MTGLARFRPAAVAVAAMLAVLSTSAFADDKAAHALAEKFANPDKSDKKKVADAGSDAHAQPA